MPCTPDSSTWSAVRKASITLTFSVAEICSSRSFGITISVSHSVRSCLDARLGLRGALLALEGERAGDHADGQRAELARDATR